MSGNGAVILTNPDAPTALANLPLITDATKIGLTWQTGSANGGTPVIDYRLSWDQGTNTYQVLAIGITTTSYTTIITLTSNTVFKFKVESRNAFGFSDYSNEVTILQAEKPLKPADPVTSVLTDVSVVITWTAPSNQGSPITSYLILIR